MQRSKFAMGLAAAWLLTSILTAGEMEPWAPPGPTMKPLDNIEPRTALHPEMFPLTIETPGSYYLAENIIASGGIVIVADGVTIDLTGAERGSWPWAPRSASGSGTARSRTGPTGSIWRWRAAR
jgi:hypothetical protein